MGIGTVVAILVVANLPKSGGIPCGDEADPFAPAPPCDTPIWKKDIVETCANGDLEYLKNWNATKKTRNTGLSVPTGRAEKRDLRLGRFPFLADRNFHFSLFQSLKSFSQLLIWLEF